MKKLILISLILIALLSVSVSAAIERVLSSTQVDTGTAFTVKYVVSGINPPYFFSIRDDMSGGCTVMGSTSIVTTLTSPQTETGTITVTAPSTDATCYFEGDSKLGSSEPIDFTQGTVKVGTGIITSNSNDSSNIFIWIFAAIAGFFILKNFTK